jgi:hypothetical protein
VRGLYRNFAGLGNDDFRNCQTPIASPAEPRNPWRIGRYHRLTLDELLWAPIFRRPCCSRLKVPLLPPMQSNLAILRR